MMMWVMMSHSRGDADQDRRAVLRRCAFRFFAPGKKPRDDERALDG